MSEKEITFSTTIGPTHPAFKEPIQLSFELHGEEIVAADFVPGQAHRGVEWMGMRRNPVQILYLAERICGICGVTHAMSFARAVEQIAGIEVPRRAHYLRSIACEWERIHSHLLWAGVAAHELGFDSLFYVAWQAREKVLDLMEDFTGSRVHYSTIAIGGVRRDLDDRVRKAMDETLAFYESVFEQLRRAFLEDDTVRLRCVGTGVLTAKEALELCAVGPTARASGIPWDVRQDHPYAAYAEVPVKAVLPDAYTGETHGDVYDRIVVRVFEILQSVQLLHQLLDQLPEGPINACPKPVALLMRLKKATGEAVGMHEAPRGEVSHYVRLAAAEAPLSWKVKASSYSNYMSWVPMLVGEQVADIPIIAASIDPCISCTDRVLVRKGGGSGGASSSGQVLTKADLTRLSVAKTRRLQASAAARAEVVR
ncbi:MAG: nickel-dependent hydrogenase large subunit [Kiritimatiellae bacterium]|nr:nickel-dependent hydrogenase large subunit [Kiritimatiellia bacterium]MBQ9343985.1 nickel-dependent hydrogenase large subunit [Kiritimatiellia bacterium]